MYINVADAAKKFNISRRRVQLLCKQGRIEGANMVNGVWMIPSEAQKPTETRKKSPASENQLTLSDDLNVANDIFRSIYSEPDEEIFSLNSLFSKQRNTIKSALNGKATFLK